MKILKNYEFITEARKLYLKIKDETLDNLAYLVDDGYDISCKDDLRWIIVYISIKRSNTAFWEGIKLSDIKDDIMTYIEYMNIKYDIQFIEFFGRKESISDKTEMGRSKIYQIDELENTEDFYFTSLKIAFNKRWKK
jgi:hypothetical protein